jgi:hypothetical protein
MCCLVIGTSIVFSVKLGVDVVIYKKFSLSLTGDIYAAFIYYCLRLFASSSFILSSSLCRQTSCTFLVILSPTLSDSKIVTKSFRVKDKSLSSASWD